jgi:hypothetical protein
MRKTILILGLQFLALVSCMNQQSFVKSDDTASSKSVSITDNGTFEIQGTIVYKSLEGGFFAIESDDGKTYDPINLPETFKRDGLKVKVNAKLRKDVGSIHMAGDIIEIVNIAAE